jgi:hypothetical protein
MMRLYLKTQTSRSKILLRNVLKSLQYPLGDCSKSFQASLSVFSSKQTTWLSAAYFPRSSGVCAVTCFCLGAFVGCSDCRLCSLCLPWSACVPRSVVPCRLTVAQRLDPHFTSSLPRAQDVSET